jgi:hypothetical protein
MIIEAAVAAVLGMAVTEWRNGGDYVQHFTVEGSPFVSTVTRRLGAISGVIYDADGHGRDLDDAAPHTPRCASIEPPADLQVAASSARHRATAPERVVIDVMELYTLAAENGAGGRAQIEAKIAAAVDLLNSTLQQSRIYNVTFRLVHVARVDRDETLNQLQYLIWLSNDAGVAKLRDEHRADLVGLWTEADAEIAWAPRSFARSTGFHVISRRYPLSLQLFSHEVAHNLGAQHNVEQTGPMANDPYPFARGIRTATSMTVMSYPPAGQWRETLPLFSNPDLTYDGVPLGIAGQADNARMIRFAGPIVAEYYRAID